jgi:hypothetical protein
MLEQLIEMRDRITLFAKQNDCLKVLEDVANKLVDPTLFDERQTHLDDLYLLLLMRKMQIPPLSEVGLAFINRWVGICNAYVKVLQRQLANPVLNLRMVSLYLKTYYPDTSTEDAFKIDTWDQQRPIQLSPCTEKAAPGLFALLTKAKQLIETIQSKNAIHMQRLPEIPPHEARLNKH